NATIPQCLRERFGDQRRVRRCPWDGEVHQPTRDFWLSVPPGRDLRERQREILITWVRLDDITSEALHEVAWQDHAAVRVEHGMGEVKSAASRAPARSAPACFDD